MRIAVYARYSSDQQDEYSIAEERASKTRWQRLKMVAGA